MRPPVGELEHEPPLPTTLPWVGQQLRFADVASYVAPKVWQQVYAIPPVGLAWWVILEHCKQRVETSIINLRIINGGKHICSEFSTELVVYEEGAMFD